MVDLLHMPTYAHTNTDPIVLLNRTERLSMCINFKTLQHFRGRFNAIVAHIQRITNTFRYIDCLGIHVQLIAWPRICSARKVWTAHSGRVDVIDAFCSNANEGEHIIFVGCTSAGLIRNISAEGMLNLNLHQHRHFDSTQPGIAFCAEFLWLALWVGVHIKSVIYFGCVLMLL